MVLVKSQHQNNDPWKIIPRDEQSCSGVNIKKEQYENNNK